jgi:hypothetical protein
MRMSEVLIKPPSETRVMVKQYRFHPRANPIADPASDVWLDSGNLDDWLGEALARVEWIAAADPGSTEPHSGEIRFEAYLDGELIGEIRDDAGGRTYYALA